MDDELRYHAPDPALLDRFLDRVRRGDPTDAAFLAEYRGVIRPQIEALPPQDAAAVISHLENALVPQQSAFCAMLLADEAATLLRLGANARALGVLQDACAMSAACRDAQGMVESSFLLARCFAAMNDAPSARRSAALCMRAITHHFGADHPLAARAAAYLADPLEAYREDFAAQKRVMAEPANERNETEARTPEIEETAFDDDLREETNAADEKEQIEDIETPDEFDLLMRERNVPAEEPFDDAPQAKTDDGDTSAEETTGEITEETEETIEETPEEASDDAVNDAIDDETDEDESQISDGARVELQMPDGLRVGFAKKSAPDDARGRDARTAFFVAARNGLLTEDSPLDEALGRQIDAWREAGRLDAALVFLSKLEEALPEDSAYRLRASLYTAAAFADAGDDARAIGLYARLVGKLLDERGAHDAAAIDAMRRLAALYERTRQYPREEKLRRLIFGAAGQTADDADAYLSSLVRAADDLPTQTALCLWRMKNGPASDVLNDAVCDAVRRAAETNPAQENETIEKAEKIDGFADVLKLCGAYCDFCAREEKTFPAELARAWFASALLSADAESAAFAAREFADECEEFDDPALAKEANALSDALSQNAEASEDAAALKLAAARIWRNANDEERSLSTANELLTLLTAAGDDEAARRVREEFSIPEPEKEPEPERAPYDEAAVSALRETAQAQEKADDWENAAQSRKKIYELRRDGLGADHPDTLAALNNFAGATLKSGGAREATELYEQAVAGYEKTLGAQHAYTVTALCNLARALDRAAEYDKSFAVWQRVYTLRAKTLGADDEKTVRAMERMERAAQRAAGKH